MHGNTIRTTLLTLAALAWTAGAAGGELPARAQRIWAPTGDLIGLQDHATAAYQVLDAHGSEAKGAEDWQLLGKHSGSLLLGWHHAAASGHVLDLRGYGTNEAGGLNARVGLAGTLPGKARWSVLFRNADHYFDRTSEMRRPGFKRPPAPPALAATPHLEWRKTDVDLGYRPGGATAVGLTFDRMCREGTRGSLLRALPGTGATGPEAPAVKTYDTERNALAARGRWNPGALSADLEAGYAKAEGTRSLDTRQVHTDDRKQWRVKLDAAYAASPRLRLLGGVAASGLQSEGGQVRTEASASDGETSVTAGRLGLVSRLGRATTVRLAGLVQALDTDARQDGAGGILQAVDRERSRREVRASLTHAGLARTRLELRYRYRQSDLDETTAEGGLPGGAGVTRVQAVAQDSERHELTFRARRRLGGAAQLRVRAGWHRLEVDETVGGDAWLWTMGDRERERLAWELALRTAPARALKIDLGWRGWDQTFTRPDEGSETTWQAGTVFADLNWAAHERAALYGTVSWGSEQVELSGDPVPAGTMGPTSYDGTTLRFMPGATVRVLAAVWCDAMYEGVRFEDDPAGSPALDALQADHDRVLLRARWNARADRTVAVTYRRHEFDENRWDDYIQDIWQVSVTGRF